MLQLRYFRKLVQGLLIVTLCFSPLAYARAESAQLRVEPTVTRLEMMRGDTWSTSLTVANEDSQDRSYTIKVVNFVPDEYGALVPVFTPEALKAGGENPSSWLAIPETSMTVPGGKRGQVPVTINVPIDVTPGGYYLGVLFGTSPTVVSEGSGASVQSFVTAAFDINVSGSVVERGRLRELAASKRLFFGAPLALDALFSNDGTSKLAPEGTVALTNRFFAGASILQRIKFPTISASQSARLRIELSDLSSLAPGLYEASMRVGYGSLVPQFTEAGTSFWVLPYRFIVLVLVSLGLVLGLILFVFRLGKRQEIKRNTKGHKRHKGH